MRFPGSCEACKYRLLDDYFPRRLYLLNDPNPPPSKRCSENMQQPCRSVISIKLL